MTGLKMSKIPNIITSIRILGAVLLLFVPAFEVAFFVIFTISGITDALDGFIARKFNATSELGSKLDSIADLLFYGIMVVKLFPVMIAKLPMHVWVMLGVVLALRLVIYGVAAIKYRKFASLHTYLTKLSSALVFFAPYFAPTPYFSLYCTVWCALGILAAAEELAIHLTSREYTSSRKSIFIK